MARMLPTVSVSYVLGLDVTVVVLPFSRWQGAPEDYGVQNLGRLAMPSAGSFISFHNGTLKYMSGDGSPIRPGVYTCRAHQLIFIIWALYLTDSRRPRYGNQLVILALYGMYNIPGCGPRLLSLYQQILQHKCRREA